MDSLCLVDFCKDCSVSVQVPSHLVFGGQALAS